MPKPRSAPFSPLPHSPRHPACGRLDMVAVLLIMLSLIGNSFAIAGTVGPALLADGAMFTLCADGHAAASPAKNAPDSHDCNDACCILCLSALMAMGQPGGAARPFTAAMTIPGLQMAAPLLPWRMQGQPGNPRAPPAI